MILSSVLGKILQKDTLAGRWGYDQQTRALDKRARRCAKAWESHVKDSHAVLNDFLVQHGPVNSILVLGSGLLLETPIQTLLKFSDKVILADLSFSAQAKLAAKQNPKKVQLIDLDLTALLSSLPASLAPQRRYGFADVERLVKQLSPAAVTQYWPQAELVISANILSQLPLNIVDRMRGTEAEKETARNIIRQQHIQFLQAYNRTTLLVSDFVVKYLDRDGNEISKAKFDLAMSEFTEMKNWSWEVAPIPEYDKKVAVSLEVKAYQMLGASNGK